MKGPTFDVFAVCDGCDHHKAAPEFGQFLCGARTRGPSRMSSTRTPFWCPYLFGRMPGAAPAGRWSDWEKQPIEHCGYHGFEEIVDVAFREWKAGIVRLREDDLTIAAVITHETECEVDAYSWFSWEVDVRLHQDTVSHLKGDRFAVYADAVQSCQAECDRLVWRLGPPVAHLNHEILTAMAGYVRTRYGGSHA
jgi:hypothetical protein